ncbi:Putative ribosomal N-acetyltransferase YdaF [Vibrio aerogenes CECT 7868]|uniref:Putative ribosomal N-acetyltransferase YdaF n=1 Tax=Vibrio aerogenes CECT 7868 TaxID=1216006 RepID=A0A1M5V7J6_9VIBR|nr:GNAT family N-acetyltransferase [Vibrio aerogenes]SHH71195.1 Putative ribosomal N-acetyltransferase YdaF [Vibrio aerogenes CECT 7868]
MIDFELTESSLLMNEVLALVPVRRSDAPVIQKLANDPLIASTSLSIQYPLPAGWAKEWIEHLDQDRQSGHGITFTIQRRHDHQVMGVVSLLDINYRFENAELAYWLGKPFRGNGYATQATRLAVNYGFSRLALHRIYAFFLTHNLNSEKVLQRLGMRYEGELRQHIKKDGVFMNSGIYGVLADEFS